MGVALETNSPEYKRVHKELYETFGLASGNDCEKCGKPARDWAWDGEGDPMDISNYMTLCRSCHRLKDYTPEWKARQSEGAKRMWARRA